MAAPLTALLQAIPREFVEHQVELAAVPALEPLFEPELVEDFGRN